jgi:high-affinity nickel-transport protein
MPALPTDWSALLPLVFVLGLRHGIDADHIATIDALTRLQAGRRRLAARWCGALFALGHGAVVLAVVATLALATHGWQAPAWLAPLGSAVSIALLAALGVANLRAVLGSAPGQAVALQGWRGRGLGRLLGHGHPAAAAAVGALFALSFDTIGLAVMFALAGTAVGGAGHAALLGAAFAGGMLITDGANGWWLARLLSCTDATAARASRLTAAAVAVVSLGVAALGVARWVSPAADAWAEGLGGWLGAALVAGVTGLTLAMLWRHHGRSAPQTAAASEGITAA